MLIKKIQTTLKKTYIQPPNKKATRKSARSGGVSSTITNTPKTTLRQVSNSAQQLRQVQRAIVRQVADSTARLRRLSTYPIAVPSLRRQPPRRRS